MKMATHKDIRFKHHAVIEFLTAEQGCSAKDIHERTLRVYGNACVDYTTVWRWAQSLKCEEFHLPQEVQSCGVR